MAILMTGQPAPDFTLFASDKSTITLSHKKGGQVLLLFFPLAFTSTCTEELCQVRDSLATYNDLDTTVLGISVDSIFTLAKYKEEQHLNFPLLSDFNKEVSSLYGCLYPEFGFNMKGVSKRAAFVIDKEGILVHSEILENAGHIPDFDRIMEALRRS